MKAMRSCIVVITILLFFAGCAEVPLTHRRGLHLLPQSQMMALSLQQYDKVLKESRLSKDQQKVNMVQRVGRRISGAAEEFMRDSGLADQIKNYQWEFNLIQDDKTVNAWCMPGGKIAVYTGILKYTRDETGLAVVVGHEVAHAIARHGNERMSQGLLVSLGGMALSVAIREKPAMTQQIFMGAFGLGASVGVLLPYSRVHEYEADRIGLTIMAMAGYDPRKAVDFWQRMAKQGGARPPEFLSTHPATEERIARIRELVQEAIPYYERSRKRR